jgi:ATPase subunit of ABC transporter with duplicated ATPase domains
VPAAVGSRFAACPKPARTRARPRTHAAQADELAALQEDAELPLELKAGGALDGFVIQLMGVGFKYPGGAKPLFQGAELGIDSSSRIVLLGENGNGKTTLVKVTGAHVRAFESLEAGASTGGRESRDVRGRHSRACAAEPLGAGGSQPERAGCTGQRL